jgi:hypothetical protein
MVSPLSTRLFNIEGKTGSSNYPHFIKNNKISRQGHQLVQIKRVSGYSADKENGQPNSSTTSVEKEKRAKLIGMASRKRKKDELHYQAATACSTLAQGGHLYKRSRLVSFRTLPDEGIDTKRTKLISVSRGNPYEEMTEKVDVYDLSIYSEMVQSCKQFYSLGGRRLSNDRKNAIQDQEEDSSATNSTISSKLSDTESDYGTTYKIPARFEDGNKNSGIRMNHLPIDPEKTSSGNSYGDFISVTG